MPNKREHRAEKSAEFIAEEWSRVVYGNPS